MFPGFQQHNPADNIDLRTNYTKEALFRRLKTIKPKTCSGELQLKTETLAKTNRLLANKHVRSGRQ